MTGVLTYLGTLLQSGWISLLDYLAAHVLLCLVPAFIIAGYLSAAIPKEAITRWLGPRAPKWISYPASALGGFVLAVCSCTILPLFSGIWKRGAGLGPAVTFLFVGPAINILALTYTAAAIGADIAIARLALSIFFGILIGLLMAWIFRREETAAPDAGLFDQKSKVKTAIWWLLILQVSILIAGTLQIPLLTGSIPGLTITLPTAWLNTLAPLGLTVQGAALIIMLMFIGLAAWKGFEPILDGWNRWANITLALVALTILMAAPIEQGAALTVNGRSFIIPALIALVLWIARRQLTIDERINWAFESWKFVKQIFPLLLVGVFAAGIIKVIIPSEWVRSVAGSNTILANLVGVVFGVFMYFPTLVEVPIAKMFLDLGMARGPLLAYLLADPELSLQSILVLGKVMGRKKTAVYVGLVAVFATLAGWLFGIFINH
jgi:uncharacterized membrane protein YraQ (UPF0718 family)